MKLVRDRIPEIIEKDNKTPIYREVSSDEKLRFLAAKILEESEELKEAIESGCINDMIEEMADLLEVIDEVKRESQICDLVLSKTKKDKADKRGKFLNGYILERVDG